MEKVNLKYLKALIKENRAKDITHGTYPEGLEKIAYSSGKSGINGGLLMDDNGALYVIVGRYANLFRLFGLTDLFNN